VTENPGNAPLRQPEPAAGDPVAMAEADDAPVQSGLLGADVLAGQVPQALVPTGPWQAARAINGWALVSCVVSPGFEFAGFHMAPEGWSPGR